MRRGAKREDTLLRSTFLLVASCTTKRCIEAVNRQRLLECNSLHYVGVDRGPVDEGIYPGATPLLIDMDNQIEF